MPAIPESTRSSIILRLLDHADKHWPQLAKVQARYHGSFAYITGVLPGGEQIPLFRLRYGGSAHSFGFAIYSPARDRYDDAVLLTGLPIGSPQEALDTACTFHLAALGYEPESWPPTNLRCPPLSHTRGATGGQVRKFFDVPVDDDWIPIIRSQWYWRRHRPEGRTKNDHWPQLPTLWRDEISSSYLNEVPKDNDGLADIFDILGSDCRGRIIVSVIAHDSWSGTRKLFYKRFLQHDVKIVNLSGENQGSNYESGLGWPPITDTGHRAGK
jgi:hypothetical protein